jgi:spore coat protein U-like protein
MTATINRRNCMVLILLALALPGLEAKEVLRLLSAPGVVTGTYLPDDGAVITGTISVGHCGPATRYFLTFAAGQSGKFNARLLKSGASQLSYQIYDNPANRNVLKDLSANPSATEVLTGSFPCSSGLQQQSLNFTVFLPAGQLPAAGQYRDAVLVELYSGTPRCHGWRRAFFCLSILVAMNTVLEVSLVRPGAPFDNKSTALALDSGILAAGKTLDADLIVRANSRYTISVFSQNGGVLRNPDPGDASRVAYRFTSNGQSWSLPPAAAQPIVSRAAPTPLAGARYALSVVVGEVGWVTEGSYSDVLTFQAAAN